ILPYPAGGHGRCERFQCAGRGPGRGRGRRGRPPSGISRGSETERPEMRTPVIALGLCGLIACPPVASAADALRDEAARALRRAVAYFREHVATEGGYVYRYSIDLSRREGEERTGPTTAWI